MFGEMMEKRFVKDIFHPIDELKKIRYQLIEDIEYWEEMKITEKVKYLKAQKNDYDRAISCLDIDLYKYD